MNKCIELFCVNENSEFPTFNYFYDFSNTIKNHKFIKVIQNSFSQNGNPLVAFEIGNGPKVIGLTAGAHADEPIGVLTLKYFIETITKRSEFEKLLEKYTFIIHPLVDPDGYKLNTKWFTNPIKYENYYLNNFRNNNPTHDCEHGIPFQSGQSIRPEMKFVKENLDLFKNRFDYYVTLHSSHILPGACFVFDQNNKNVSLREKITTLCENYQLPMMDYKVQGEDTLTYLGPGFIGGPNVSKMLEQYKNQPEVLSQIKMTTYEYAQEFCGAKTAFISELPIWLSSGFDDYTDSNMTMNEYMEKSFLEKKEYMKNLEDIKKMIDKFNSDENNIWIKTINTSLSRGPAHLRESEKKLGSYEGFAQGMLVSELTVQKIESKMKLLKYGIKALEENADASSIVNDWLSEFNQNVKIYERQLNLVQLSIKTQVEIQLGLIFSGIENLENLV
jgi:hypothetical protein